MTAAISRAVMALAASCLGEHRREWALAMQAEFEAASEDGKSLAFALGCLITAWRELPAHEEGRFVIASHVLACLLVVPAAALIVAGLLTGFPQSYLGQIGGDGLLQASGAQKALLNEANGSAVPSLASLMAFLAASHVRIAWLVLERDWARAASAGALIAASTVTLILFTIIVFDYYASALTQAVALGAELAAISALARWHGRSWGGSPALRA
jgi:hypothetical protein